MTTRYGTIRCTHYEQAERGASTDLELVLGVGSLGVALVPLCSELLNVRVAHGVQTAVQRRVIVSHHLQQGREREQRDHRT